MDGGRDSTAFYVFVTHHVKCVKTRKDKLRISMLEGHCQAQEVMLDQFMLFQFINLCLFLFLKHYYQSSFVANQVQD